MAIWAAGGTDAVTGWLTDVTTIVDATDSLLPLAVVTILRTCCWPSSQTVKCSVVRPSVLSWAAIWLRAVTGSLARPAVTG